MMLAGAPSIEAVDIRMPQLGGVPATRLLAGQPDPPTVKSHVSHLLEKLEADNRVQIALLVQAAGEARGR